MKIYVKSITDQQREQALLDIANDVRLVGRHIEIMEDDDALCTYADDDTLDASNAVSVVEQVLNPEEYGQ